MSEENHVVEVLPVNEGLQLVDMGLDVDAEPCLPCAFRNASQGRAVNFVASLLQVDRDGAKRPASMPAAVDEEEGCHSPTQGTATDRPPFQSKVLSSSRTVPQRIEKLSFRPIWRPRE